MSSSSGDIAYNKPLPSIPLFKRVGETNQSNNNNVNNNAYNQNGTNDANRNGNLNGNVNQPPKPVLSRSPSDIGLEKNFNPSLKMQGFSYFSPPIQPLHSSASSPSTSSSSSSRPPPQSPPPQPPRSPPPQPPSAAVQSNPLESQSKEEEISDRSLRKSVSYTNVVVNNHLEGKRSPPAPPKPPPKPGALKGITTINQALEKVNLQQQKEAEVEGIVNDLRMVNTRETSELSPRAKMRKANADKEVNDLLDLLKEMESDSSEKNRERGSGTLNRRYQEMISKILSEEEKEIQVKEIKLDGETEEGKSVKRVQIAEEEGEEEDEEEESSLPIQSKRDKWKNSRNTVYGGFESLVVKRGYLVKQGGKFKNWKGRYFVLEGNLLYYFKSPNSTHPTGVIPLIDVRVDRADASAKRKFTLEISAINKEDKNGLKTCKFNQEGGEVIKGNHQTFLMSAPNEGLAADWKRSIEESIVISKR